MKASSRIGRFLLIVCYVTSPTLLRATIIAIGNSGNTTQTFNRSVQSEVFERSTGTIYVGLSANSTGTTDNFAVAKAPRVFNTSIQPVFTGIGTSTIFTSNNSGVSFLALASTPGNTNPIITGVPITDAFLGTTVFAMNNDGSNAVQSATLLDASGAVGTAGAATSGIVGSTANNNFIFAAVAPNGGNWGDANSGIAVVKITSSLVPATGVPVVQSVTQTAAVSGDSAIKAQLLDPTTPQVRINVDPTIMDSAEMFWDNHLQRLYIGLSLVETAPITDAGARSVIVGQVSSTGVLTLTDIAPDSAFAPGNEDEIVGEVNGADMSVVLTATQIAVMHTSTGLSYLIVNGGVGAAFNQVYALPLVDDPTNPATNGTLANKNQSVGIGGVFTIPAILPGDMTLSTDLAAIVGTAPLPTSSTADLSDMVVVGDTVYISSDAPQSAATDSGLFFSQAMFDDQGRIAEWSPWKRAFPFDSSKVTFDMVSTMSTTVVDGIDFFDVDAVTGNIWAVGAFDNQSVALTSWSQGVNAPSSLAARLNQQLPEGSYSVLELDWYTRGFDGQTPNRYTLFGGVNKVVFSLTSTLITGTTPALGPTFVTSNFSVPSTFASSQLPPLAGCVNSLEYARRTATEGETCGAGIGQNFFFAGTGNGLYVFSNADGSGFNPGDLGTIDMPPFSTGIWQQAPNIFGSVIALASRGASLYVLVFQTSAQTPFKSILYRVGPACSVAAMFAPGNISVIAETGVDIFQNTLLFTGMQLIATNLPLSSTTPLVEQLVLTTNTGLYRSDASQSAGAQGIATATSQTAANWQPANTTAMYNGIAGIDAASSTTVWPFSLQSLQCNNTQERTSIEQWSGDGNPTPPPNALFTNDPVNFNALSSVVTYNSLPGFTYFWDDGARRFFIVKSLTTVIPANALMVWPYAIDEWAITLPEQDILTDPILTTVARFNWVHLLGSQGILFAGTNSGVVALE